MKRFIACIKNCLHNALRKVYRTHCSQIPGKNGWHKRSWPTYIHRTVRNFPSRDTTWLLMVSPESRIIFKTYLKWMLMNCKRVTHNPNCYNRFFSRSDAAVHFKEMICAGLKKEWKVAHQQKIFILRFNEFCRTQESMPIGNRRIYRNKRLEFSIKKRCACNTMSTCHAHSLKTLMIIVVIFAPH